MQKRPLVVAVVMLLASLVSYDVMHMTAVSAALEVADTTTTVGVGAGMTPQVLPITTVELGEVLGSISDPTVFFAAGVVLFGLAAVVRRHTC